MGGDAGWGGGFDRLDGLGIEGISRWGLLCSLSLREVDSACGVFEFALIEFCVVFLVVECLDAISPLSLLSREPNRIHMLSS